MSGNSTDQSQVNISSDVVRRIVSGAVSNVISALQREDTSALQRTISQPAPSQPPTQRIEMDSDEEDFVPRTRKRCKAFNCYFLICNIIVDVYYANLYLILWVL